MICPGCNQDLPEKDFLPKQNECYRCIYSKKTYKIKQKGEKKCKICGAAFIAKNYRVYCTDECKEKGSKIVKNERWAEDYQGQFKKKFNSP